MNPDLKPSVPAPASSSGIICLKPAPAPAPTKTLPKIDSANTLLADHTLAAPAELVAGVLHRGTKAVLAGSSKVGKTWILLALAISVATGTPFLRWLAFRGRVLLINLEIHRAFIKERLAAMATRMGLTDLGDLDVWTLRGNGSGFDMLFQEIVTHTKGEHYDLIILDPIYKLMGGHSENTASGVGALASQIEPLIEKTGASVLYAHHFTKGNSAKKKALDRLSGSGVFARDADTILTLTEHEEESCYVVEMTLRNFPPQPAFVVQWDFPVMVERRDLDPADLKRSEDKQEDDLEPVVELLDEKALTTGEWQAAALANGYSRATFFRIKQKLLEANRVAESTGKTWTRATKDVPESQVSSSVIGETLRPKLGMAQTEPGPKTS